MTTQIATFIIGTSTGILFVAIALEPDEIRQNRYIILPVSVVAAMMMVMALFMV